MEDSGSKRGNISIGILPLANEQELSN